MHIRSCTGSIDEESYGDSVDIAGKRRPGRPVSPELNERRRQEVIACAARLFAERGYHATTVGDIAQMLGCTKGLIYHYFPSKADLAERTLIGARTAMRKRIEAIADSALTPSMKLHQAIEDFVTEILFGYQRYLVILADRAEIVAEFDSARREANRRDIRAFVMVYRRIIVEGIKSGEFEPVDPSLLANAVIQGIIGIARWYKPEGRLSPDEVRRDMCLMLLRMVAKECPTSADRTLARATAPRHRGSRPSQEHV